MSSALKKQKKVTVAQQEVLCEFFEENPEVIRGYKKKPNCIEAVQSKWMEVTPRLNELGPPRTYKDWAKYLCDLKAKLKRKRIKWKQRSDGSGPLICNAEEFSEIVLRMLQIMRKDTGANACTPDSGGEDSSQNFNEDSDSPILPPKVKKSQEIRHHDRLTTPQNVQPSRNTLTPPIFENQSDIDDEFDTFSRNVAQQLRSLPLALALETQEEILSMVRKKRVKVLSECYSNVDPLDKH